jgi:hypothetical protein
MAKFEPKFREGLRKDMLEAGATNDEVDCVLQAVAGGRCRAGPTQDWLVTSAVRLIPTIHSELQEMHWTFLTVPDGDPDLLIGDCPVMLAEPSADDQPQKTLGLRNRNIELVMPLGRRMVAIARHDGPDSFGELMKGSADVINSRTLAYARRFVFAPCQSDALLADIVKLRGTGPQVRVKRIQAGKRLIIVSEYGE